MLSTAKLNTDQTGPLVINHKRLGDLGEQWVYLLAAWKGCEVFPNINSTGKTDIILKHPDKGMIEIDVKVSSWCKNTKGNWWWNTSNACKVKPPVYAVVVMPSGDITGWSVRWRKGYAPPGWEDFWTNDHRTYKTASTKPNETPQASSRR